MNLNESKTISKPQKRNESLRISKPLIPNESLNISKPHMLNESYEMHKKNYNESINKGERQDMGIKEAFPEFEKPSVAIDIVILKAQKCMEETERTVPNRQLQVLLVKEKLDNSSSVTSGTPITKTNSQWHLPGTILRLGETPKDAINRIIEDKTHLSDMYIEQLYTEADNVERDERGHILSIVYIGIVKSDVDIEVKESDRFDLQWAWVEKNKTYAYSNSTHKGRMVTLENDLDALRTLKYDHMKLIDDTVNRLKGKLLYTDIGFRFISEKFTLKELELTFNAINERVIPGFRRYIAPKVEGTGVMSDGKYFRPAEIYKEKGMH